MDRLEELVERGRRMPFGSSVSIDREAFLNIVDQMRITIPTEIRRYQEFEAERERHIAQAQQDARTILEQARDDATRMLDEQPIKVQAAADAERIMDRARREAEEVRAGADNYALATLQELDRQVQRLANTIRNGLEELANDVEERSAAQAARATTVPAGDIGNVPEPAGE